MRGLPLRALPLSLALLASSTGPALAAAPAAVAETAPYTREQAEQDLEVVVAGSGREYLAARARLSDHVPLAHEVALAALIALDERAAKLEAGGAYSPDSPAAIDIERKRGRIIAVLGEAREPADAPRFAERMRAVLQRPDAKEDWAVLLDPWRPLLLGLGPAAAPEFVKLAGDTKLSVEQREFFLEDLVSVTPVEQLASLCARIGRGDATLEHALRRSLIRRAREDRSATEPVISTLDQLVAAAETHPSTRAAAILIRQRITGLLPEQETQLIDLALDAEAAFGVRAAALLALGQAPAARMKIEALAAEHLDPARRSEQHSELLAWLALESLPAARRSALDARFDLRRAASPRLATVGWQSAQLDPDATWLEDALAHPWPEVRREGIARVGAGCANAARNRLRTLSGPQSAGGERDEQLARATIGALGRCGDFEGLRRLAESDGIGFERRGVAARALVEHDPEGPRFVAALLGTKLDPHLGNQFAAALGYTSPERVDESVITALCTTEATNPAGAGSARRSRKQIAPRAGCPATRSK